MKLSVDGNGFWDERAPQQSFSSNVDESAPNFLGAEGDQNERERRVKRNRGIHQTTAETERKTLQLEGQVIQGQTWKAPQ